MTIAEPLAYGEDKSPELEAGIHKLARADAAFRQTETSRRRSRQFGAPVIKNIDG